MIRRTMRHMTGVLLVLMFGPVYAEGAPTAQTAPEATPARGVDQLIYKGIVGNALEAIPMDPERRVSLQRANAVVSNALSGRSLTALSKLSNPALLVGGILWGVWAAANISSPVTTSDNRNDSATPLENTAAAERPQLVAPAIAASQNVDAASPAAWPGTGSPYSGPSRPRVVRVWLTQPGIH